MQKKVAAVTAAVVAAGVLSAASPVQAQTSVGFRQTWNVMPYVSAFDPDNKYGIGGTGYGAGLRFGVPLPGNENWEIQGGASHARRAEGNKSIDQDLLGADIAYFFSRSALQPYLALGAGAERDKRGLLGVGNHATSPYIDGALGLRYMFTNNIGLQAEYRRVQGWLTHSNRWGFRHSGDNYFNLGLLIAFGDTPKPPPVVAPPPAPKPPPKVEAAPPPPPQKAPPPPPPPPQRITLQASELFPFDSPRLKVPVPALDDFAAALQANPDITRVVITGHTDQIGSDAYNRRLSLQRAEAVKAYMVGKGVAASRLATEGVASTHPVVDCKSGTLKQRIDCGAPNRRVEVEPITVPKR